MLIRSTFLGGTTLFQTTTTLRRCTVATAVLVAVGSTALGLGTTAAVADTAPTASSAAVSTSSDTPATDDAVSDAPSAATPATEAPSADGTLAGSNAAPSESATPTDAAPTEARPVDATPGDAPTSAAQPAAAPSAEATSVVPAAATPAGTATVSGTVMRWHTLTADTSGWPADTSFTYQWQTAFAGGDPIDLPGATQSTTTISPVLGDLDQLRVVVTGTAPGQEPTAVTSALTGPVAENPDMRWGYLGVRTGEAPSGVQFSAQLNAFDGDGLQYFVSGGPEGGPDASVLPAGLTFAADGTLSGTPTTTGVIEFWVHTSTGTHPNGTEVSRYVLTVQPGAVTDMSVVIRGAGTATTAPTWLATSDGTVTHSDSPEVQTGDVTAPIRVRQDGSLELDALGFDQQDNVAPLEDLTWSSSEPGDTFTPTGAVDAVTLRFVHASPHVITARSGSVSVRFTVQVDPVPAAATSVSTTPRTPAGQLAFTGADPSSPLAWALGLMAAGAALVVARVRRRRA